MAPLTGARGQRGISADQRSIDMAQRITLLEPESTPLTVLSKRVRSVRAIDTVFNWLEDAREPRFDTTNNTATNVTTTIPVTNPTYYAEHDIVRNTRTGELFRVVDVGATTLTVVRGVGNSGTGIAMNNADELMILCSAQPEGDTAKQPRSSNPTKKFNYVQDFRTPWEVTDRVRASTQAVSPTDWNHQANKHGIEHAISLEMSALYGKADLNTAGAQERTVTGGLLSFLSSNTYDAGGALTNPELDTVFRQNFRFGSKRKLFLVAPLVASALNSFAQGKLQTHQGDDTFGLAVQSYLSPFGRLDTVVHWLLDGNVYGGYGIVVDLDEIAWRPLQNDVLNLDTHVVTEIQAPSAKTREDEYYTVGGWQVGQEKKHGTLTNVTSY